MPYPASVFGPSLRNRIFPALVLVALIPAALFLAACGHSSSSTTTTTGPAPIFTSTAPTALAREGVQYSYTITATTTDQSTVTYSVTTGPSEATIGATSTSTDSNGNTVSTATLTWTPTHAESRTANTFTIKGTTSKNGTNTQSFSVTPNGNINGTAVDHAVTGTGLQNYNEDLSASIVEILLPDGKGGYTTVKGSGASDGTFSVGNIPPGSFWLHVQQPLFGQLLDNYIWTNSSDVDAGRFLCCRPDATGIGQTVNTNVTLGVAPTATDTTYWLSSDANAFASILPATTNPLMVSFTQYGHLIDSSKGDRAFLVHYAQMANGVNHIVEAKEYTDITQTDGGTTTVTGSLTAVGGSTTEPVIKITQFDALFAGLTNTSGIYRHFELDDVGYSGTEGGATGVPVILADLSSTATDVDLGSIPYGLVTTTGVPYYYFQDTGIRRNQIGSSIAEATVGSIVISNAVPTSATSIVPTISMPRSASVDGRDFLSDQTNVSLTPLVAWNPPSTGTPTSYELIVTDMNAPISHFFFTNGNSVNIPAGVLEAGKSYVFFLSANLSQANTFATAPFRVGTSQTLAMMGSSVMTTASASGAAKKAASSAPQSIHIGPGPGGVISITRKK